VTWNDAFLIAGPQDLADAIRRFGFVPFFRNRIPGFSLEEHIAPGLWFTDEPGPWEWKGPVIRETGCAYGKFFHGKAVYVSRELFPDFANLRRDGYDFDARCDEGLTPLRERQLFEAADASAPVLSYELKRLAGYGRGGKKGFDAVVTRLQAQCYLLISDFIYQLDRNGRRYGWGVAEYSTPEKRFGADFTDRVYAREPKASLELLLERLKRCLPAADEAVLRRLLQS